MWTSLLFASAALLAAITTPTAGTPTYEETGDCDVNNYLRVMPIIILFFILQATHEHLYKYTAKEEYFGEENTETFEMTIHFRVFCLSGEEIWINSMCEQLAQLVQF